MDNPNMEFRYAVVSDPLLATVWTEFYVAAEFADSLQGWLGWRIDTFHRTDIDVPGYRIALRPGASWLRLTLDENAYPEQRNLRQYIVRGTWDALYRTTRPHDAL